MTCAKSQGPVEIGVLAKDFYVTSPQTYAFEPITEWMCAYGFDQMNASVGSRLDKTNMSFEYVVGYQTAATRPDVPDAFAKVGSASASTGANPRSDRAVARTDYDVAGKQWIRLAVGYRNQATTALGASRLSTALAWRACGSIVGVEAFKARTSNSTATLPSAAVTAVTDWMPAWYADLCQFAIIPTGVTGNLTLKPAYQTATTSPESADAWAYLPQASASASERNTGEMQPALAGKMWVRFGLAYYLTSGSALAQADVNVTVAARRNPLAQYGNAPANWGASDGALPVTRTTLDTRAVYSSTASPLGDYYDTPSNSGSWSLSSVAEVAGSPSGPGAWYNAPYWVGYDNSTGQWAVYWNNAGTIQTLAGGTPVTGSPCAVARVSVSGTTATFSVSFDGTSFSTLGTATGTWNWRTYIVQNGATITVRRETVTG
jgi:hypothetical protein